MGESTRMIAGRINEMGVWVTVLYRLSRRSNNHDEDGLGCYIPVTHIEAHSYLAVVRARGMTKFTLDGYLTIPKTDHRRWNAWKSVLLRVWYVEIVSNIYLLGTTASIGTLRIVLACSIYWMFTRG
jgi:hypothetical protein